MFSCPLLLSKSDSPVITLLERHSLKLINIRSPIFWLQENLIWMKEVGTEQRCTHIEITCYKISTLIKKRYQKIILKIKRDIYNIYTNISVLFRIHGFFTLVMQPIMRKTEKQEMPGFENFSKLAFKNR